ncbi:MAG: hypothetical protein IJV31_02550 [Clostridia bacterium]|nr:hypothetical protein [Clostridia bacterium]
MENKRKIIEIYVTENEEEDTTSFEFEKIENSDVANSTMKMLVYMFSKYKHEDDTLELYGDNGKKEVV